MLQHVVGIFLNDASITRLVRAMVLEQNDEWSLNRRYMQLAGLQMLSDTVPTQLSLLPPSTAHLSSFGLWTYTMGWDTTA